ncbi:MAG: AAA family ATPase [bacterium]|nr:AAA family ATPase [bacterium]
MIHLQEVRFKFREYPETNEYPFGLPLLKNTRSLPFLSPVTLFAGENGTGKSTILRAICRAAGIHIWEEQGRRRHAKSPFEERLHDYLQACWSNGAVPGSFFSSDIFRTFASALDEFAVSDPGILKYFGGSSLMNQSHGQSLLSFFGSRYSIEGLYLLDEPETALSPRSQVRLLKIIREAAWRGHAQFIIASHSPILLACPGATVYSFDHLPPKVVEYEETEYYKVYKEFLEDRGKFLGQESGIPSTGSGQGRNQKSVKG